ncbi:MAG TPA: prephenate dehydratase [Candidatus Dormibacteraeota bacterium]|jgi:prephenate dehydratase
MSRIAYLGPEGSFSEDAARRHAGEGAELVSFPDIPSAISAVSHGLVDEAVAPIENSIEGSINVTLDQLIHGKNAPGIIAELNLDVHHHLVARPGTTITEIERVVSVPAAVAQCRQFLRDHLPQVQVLPALSTSAAVASLVHSDRIAAIGNERAARLYGMDVIASDIQDADDNVTRFVVLGRAAAAATGRDKTSICCYIAEDRPGSLVAILNEFAGRNINLSKLESRPTRGGLGKYFFLIDLVGHETDVEVAAALAGVRDRCDSVLVLGSYPASEGPHD